MDARKWNEMVNSWTEGKAESPYAELMKYQGEVNNGGHYQYFTNLEYSGVLDKELPVLKEILPPGFRDILEKAYQAYLASEQNDDEEESEEEEAVLEQCDRYFYANEGEIDKILEEYASKF